MLHKQTEIFYRSIKQQRTINWIKIAYDNIFYTFFMINKTG